MGGYPFRDSAVRLIALARSEPCGCEGVRGLDGCLRCTAEQLGEHLALVRLPALTAPALRPAPPFLAHVAAAAHNCAQVCAGCGAELERGGRGTSFFPPGTVLYALPGLHTIGPEIALRPLGRASVDCQAWALRMASVTAIGFGPMRFVALLRVSTRSQTQRYGLEVQEADVRAWARRHKHRITYVVSEAVKGDAALSKRPALADALALVTAGKVDGVVVGRLDRLARDLVLQEQLIAEVDKLGGVLRSAAPVEDDHLLDNDPQRVLVRQILGAVHQYDRAMIRLRLSNGLRTKAAAGGYVGGAPPFGWVARGGQLVPVPAEQLVRQRVKEWHRSGWSLRKIADRLNSEGITTKKGHQWQANSVCRLVGNTRRAIPPGPQTPGFAQQRKAG